MNIMIAMLIAYIPFFFGMYKVFKEEQAEAKKHK